MTMMKWSKDVRRALEAKADPRVKASMEKYFLGAIDFIGVQAPIMKSIERALRPVWKTAPVEERAAFALELLRAPFMEERQIALIVLGPLVKKLPDALLDSIEEIFDEHVRDWATCDGLCSQVLRPMLVRPAARKRIKSFSRASNLWRQRASAVAFVNEARHGLYDDDIIEVCSRIVKNPERFVQLGCGWALRELSLVDRPRVLAFIDEHAQFFSREGLRYATEKMPAPVKAAAHARCALKARRPRGE
jgi:3-methyladenine DNA glycosylase AlkD